MSSSTTRAAAPISSRALEPIFFVPASAATVRSPRAVASRPVPSWVRHHAGDAAQALDEDCERPRDRARDDEGHECGERKRDGDDDPDGALAAARLGRGCGECPAVLGVQLARERRAAGLELVEGRRDLADVGGARGGAAGVAAGVAHRLLAREADGLVGGGEVGVGAGRQPGERLHGPRVGDLGLRAAQLAEHLGLALADAPGDDVLVLEVAVVDVEVAHHFVRGGLGVEAQRRDQGLRVEPLALRGGGRGEVQRAACVHAHQADDQQRGGEDRERCGQSRAHGHEAERIHPRVGRPPGARLERRSGFTRAS